MNATPLTGPLQVLGMLRAGRLPHLITVLTATRARSSYGENIATWDADDDEGEDGTLVDVPCYVGARVTGAGRVTQRQTNELSVDDNALAVLLGYQPTITTYNAVLWESVQYDIEGVRHDADLGWTELTIRRREVD